MANYNYVPLEQTIARVYELVTPERVNEKSLYKWASDGVKDVYAVDSMVDTVCFAEVINYKAKLPSNWKYINQILFNADSVDKSNPLEIYLFTTNLVPNTKASTNDAFTTTITNSTEDQDISTTDLYQSNQPLLGQPQGTYIQNHKYEYTSKPLQELQSQWKPLRQSTSNFHSAINCGLDITRECCKQTFSYNKGHNCITVSFETGWVAISYKAYPKCDKTFMIPDRESSVPQAIEKYLLYKVFEKEEIKGVQGASRLSQKYLREWELLAAKAKGKQKMFDIDTYENLKNALVRLTPHYNTYQSGFGNMSDIDHIILR